MERAVPLIRIVLIVLCNSLARAYDSQAECI